ncbi:hypothetical protein EJ08DRAFT_207922 [Tothia fuscella]|uniref:Uncharacterized protein n=1 Tax=Tothia fuscella TaxID=1048955 RepID=A0A9P4TYT1_9PEZI|nr:hypothetical protein EJ08DRAFT_207922 [Tothia fuscella]
MGKYYQNAVLNIAATSVPSGLNGFLTSRNPNTILPLKISANWEQSWPFTTQSRRGHYYLFRAPHNGRGWVRPGLANALSGGAPVGECAHFQEALCAIRLASAKIYY